MVQDIQLMARIAVSIVLEAAPFLLLGSLLSAVVDRYGDTERIARRIPKGPLGSMAVGLLGRMVLPICECGSVPLARRLLEKGVPPLTAITYMLAAPVINPVGYQGAITGDRSVDDFLIRFMRPPHLGSA